MEFRIGKYYKIKLSPDIIMPMIIMCVFLGYYLQTRNITRPISLIFAKPLLFVGGILILYIFLKFGIKVYKIQAHEASSKAGKNDTLKSITNSIFLYKKTIITMVTFLIFVLIIGVLGFIITSVLYLILTISLLGKNKIKFTSSLLISILFILSIYYIFYYILHIPLPTGIL